MPPPPPPAWRQSCATGAEAERNFFLHSYNVVHMPQGCGCVMRVVCFHILTHGDLLSCPNVTPLQDLARHMGEWSQLAGWGTTRLPAGISWPFVRCLTNTSPKKGEIDILEGVNDQGSNLVSLHTSPGTHFRSRGVRSQDSVPEQNAPCRRHVL